VGADRMRADQVESIHLVAVVCATATPGLVEVYTCVDGDELVEILEAAGLDELAIKGKDLQPRIVHVEGFKSMPPPIGMVVFTGGLVVGVNGILRLFYHPSRIAQGGTTPPGMRLA